MILISNEEYNTCINSLTSKQLQVLEDIQDGMVQSETFNSKQIKFMHDIVENNIGIKKIVKLLPKLFQC
jgi:hypothetical protein